MYSSAYHRSRFWLLAFIIAIPIIFFGCSDGTVNGPQTREPYEKPEPDPLSVSVSGTCVNDGVVISGTVKNATDTTKYAIKDSTGGVITEGTVEDGGTIPDTPVSSNGGYTVSAQDGDRQAKADLTIDCFEEPTGPGNFRRTSEKCYQVPGSWQYQGKFTVKASRGWDKIQLVNVTDQDTLVNESGITPAQGQTRTFDNDGNGLDDVRYKAIAYRDGKSAFVEYVAACDKGPGEVTVSKQCNTDTGTANFSLNIERGVQSFSIDRDGSSFDDGSGITPEFDQTLPLGGGQYEDVPNGDYSGNFTRSGISTSKDWSINCEEDKEPPTAVAKVDSTNELTAYFNGSESYPSNEIDSYEWKFGDGSSGSGVKPSHEYESPGTYTATLTAIHNNGLTDSDDVTVTVDAEPKLCGCVYNLPEDEDYLVDSKSKFFRQPFFTDNIVPVQPYSDWVKFRVDARFGGEFGDQPQPNEGFGLELAANGNSNYTDVAEDPFDGTKETWIYQDITVDADMVPVNTDVAITAVHQADPVYGMPGNNGFNSVWFKEGSGSSSKTAKASSSYQAQLQKEKQAPEHTLNKSSSDDRGSHVEVLFEVGPGESCPPRYSPRN